MVHLKQYLVRTKDGPRFLMYFMWNSLIILFLLLLTLLTWMTGVLAAILATVGTVAGIFMFVRDPAPQTLMVFVLPVVSGIIFPGLDQAAGVLEDLLVSRWPWGDPGKAGGTAAGSPVHKFNFHNSLDE